VTEAEWLACDHPELLLRYLQGRPGERKFLLFAVACLRCCWRYIGEVEQQVAELGERYAEGAISVEALRAANAEWLIGECPTGKNDISVTVRSAAWNAALDMAYERAKDGFRTNGRAFDESCERSLDELDDAAMKELRTIVLPEQCSLLRDIFGNPFRPVAVDPLWRTSAVLALARRLYESRDFSAMPILADALEDAECANAEMLGHCRDTRAVHVRGCWVLDLLLAKE
jgi:hypothetical protein